MHFFAQILQEKWLPIRRHIVNSWKPFGSAYIPEVKEKLVAQDLSISFWPNWKMTKLAVCTIGSICMKRKKPAVWTTRDTLRKLNLAMCVGNDSRIRVRCHGVLIVIYSVFYRKVLFWNIDLATMAYRNRSILCSLEHHRNWRWPCIRYALKFDQTHCVRYLWVAQSSTFEHTRLDTVAKIWLEVLFQKFSGQQENFFFFKK